MTVPVTADVLLRGQLAYLRERGFDVTVIASPGPQLDRVGERERVQTIGIPIAREISPRADAESLLALIRTLRRLRPDIVNASTAKAGTLGMLAAAATRVPHRVYLLRGLRLETERGAKRVVLGVTERLATAAAHEVVCVSESLRAAYVEGGYAHADACRVLGPGSSNGIDLQRFMVTDERRIQEARLRHDLAIPVGTPVIGFVGRPVADKGIAQLLDALELVRSTVPEVRLIVVGAGFADDHVDPEIAAHMKEHSEITVVPHVAEPAPYYALMDVLAFPSLREGFPNAPLEAAAAGVPTVGYRVTGVRDAICDGETGSLVQLGDVPAFAEQLVNYLTDLPRRELHGRAAAERAKLFARERIWEHWRAEYERLLA